MNNATNEFDAVIIGAGISGMHQLHQLRKLGLSVRVLEAGSEVGGTWYWNRYPGCRLDSESYTYGYSFSEEVLQEWSWSEEYAGQLENLRYCQFVADKFDFRRDIQFDTRVKSAVFRESSSDWEVTSEDGEVFHARYLISATGPLSAPQLPALEGMDRFEGKAFHTSFWPKDPIDFSDKRVAVIGTGSSGVQVIQELAKTAVNLTVFQRSPQWCAPLRNSPISEEKQSYIKSHYEEILAECREADYGFPYKPDSRSALEVSEQERQALYEKIYNAPGFMKWVGGFSDLLVDENANATISEFMANKIRSRIDDPKLAEKMVPKDHGYGTKRVILETDYYEVYNQDNVHLVDCRETPILELTPAGIRTSDSEYQFDYIVYATGFDAVMGALKRIDIRGVGGQKLKEKWSHGPRTYLGLMVNGFPNFMTLAGPHNSATLCNIPRCSEQNVHWVTDLIRYMETHDKLCFEPKAASEESWTQHVHEVSDIALFSKVHSWFTGKNTNVKEGSLGTPVIYIGGTGLFNKFCNQESGSQYQGLAFS